MYSKYYLILSINETFLARIGSNSTFFSHQTVITMWLCAIQVGHAPAPPPSKSAAALSTSGCGCDECGTGSLLPSPFLTIEKGRGKLRG